MRRHPHTIAREQRAMARARRALRRRPAASAGDFRNDKIGGEALPPDTEGTRSTTPHGQAPAKDTGRDSDD